MPIGDGCAAGNSGLAGLSHTTQSPVALSDVRPATRAPITNVIQGSVEYTSGGTLGTGFVAECWVVSGPGPTYTDEIRLVQMLGAQPIGALVRGTMATNQILPNAGRVFDWTRDGFRFSQNASYTASEASPLTMSFNACSAAAVSDCCAELNAKLDLVLAYVAKPFFNQP